MVAIATIRNAVKQAYTATKALQTSVVFTHYLYTGVTDTWTGKTSSTTAQQTLNAIVGEVSTDIDDGKRVFRCVIYVDENVLTLALEPDDTAAFNGETWRIERMDETSPQFIRAIHARRP